MIPLSPRRGARLLILRVAQVYVPIFPLSNQRSILYGIELYGTDTLQIRFLGDPTAKFTEAMDLAFDGTALFGGPRSKRYALEIEDGKVKALHVEPDNTGLDGKSSES